MRTWPPSIESVTVTGAGDAVIATLRRTADGWAVDERDGYPADAGKLAEVVRTLADAKALERKTAKAELYSRIGVEPISDAEAGGIELAFETADETLRVVLGDTAQGSFRYARRADAEESWLIDKNPDTPKDAVDWLERELVDIASADVESVAIRHAGGDVIELGREGDDATELGVTNVPAGRELQYASVGSGIAGALSGLTFEDVRAAVENGSEATTVSVFRLTNGLVVTVSAFGDDETWFGFEATTATPTETANPAEARTDTDEAGDPAAETATEAASAEPAIDPDARAAELNTRLGGWQYQLASYKADSLTRNWDDLLAQPQQD